MSNATQDVRRMTEGKTYNIRGRRVPDAASVWRAFVETYGDQGVEVEIVRERATYDDVYVVARARVIDENGRVVISCEDFVSLNRETLRRDLFWGLVKSGKIRDYQSNPDGSFCITNARDQATFEAEVWRDWKFSPRSAATKAMERAQRKALVLNWKSAPEEASEAREVQQVANSRNSGQYSGGGGRNSGRNGRQNGGQNSSRANAELRYGKYQGKTFLQVAENDPGYAEWTIDNSSNGFAVSAFEEALSIVRSSQGIPPYEAAQKPSSGSSQRKDPPQPPPTNTENPSALLASIRSVISRWPINATALIQEYEAKLKCDLLKLPVDTLKSFLVHVENKQKALFLLSGKLKAYDAKIDDTQIRFMVTETVNNLASEVGAIDFFSSTCDRARLTAVMNKIKETPVSELGAIVVPF